MQLVGTEVGTRFPAAGYSLIELLERRAGCGLHVGGGWRCILKPELLVLLHVGRYFRPEGFRLSGKCDILELVDPLYFRYDGVEGAAIVFRGCGVACPSCFFQGRCGGWYGLGHFWSWCCLFSGGVRAVGGGLAGRVGCVVEGVGCLPLSVRLARSEEVRAEMSCWVVVEVPSCGDGHDVKPERQVVSGAKSSVSGMGPRCAWWLH